MADNIIAPAAGDTFATDDISGVQYPRTKITLGADGVTDGDVSASNPMPVSGNVGVTGPVEVTGTFWQATQPVSGTFWQATQPVSAASLPLPTGAATETTLASIDAKTPALVSTVPFNSSAAPPTRLVGQDIWNCSFADVGASVLSSDFIAAYTGTGVSYSQAAGSLAIVAGTTANQEFFTRSVQSWRGSLRMRASIVASQRIANTNLQITLADLIGEGLSCTINSATSITVTLPGHTFTSANVGQFMQIGKISGAAGVPGRYAIASVVAGTSINFTVAGWPASGSCTLTLFGWNYCRNLLTGTTATQMAWDCQRKGWATGDTTATINTSASPGTIIQNDLYGRDAFLADKLRVSGTSDTFTARASRIENMPDDDTVLYVFIWSYNGTSNPASSTTWTIGFISVEKFANFPVFIQGARSNGNQNPIPVNINGGTVNTVTTVSTVSAATTTPAVATTTNATLNSAASTNGTVIKGSAGNLYSVAVSNINAAVRYLKIYNSATVTVGSTTPVLTIPIPATGAVNFTFGTQGFRMSAGICIGLTTGAADSDTGAVAAGEIKVMVAYI